jgi:hypothetical protein
MRLTSRVSIVKKELIGRYRMLTSDTTLSHITYLTLYSLLLAIYDVYIPVL